jgi:hypothetical protein
MTRQFIVAFRLTRPQTPPTRTTGTRARCTSQTACGRYRSSAATRSWCWIFQKKQGVSLMSSFPPSTLSIQRWCSSTRTTVRSGATHFDLAKPLESVNLFLCSENIKGGNRDNTTPAPATSDLISLQGKWRGISSVPAAKRVTASADFENEHWVRNFAHRVCSTVRCPDCDACPPNGPTSDLKPFENRNGFIWQRISI